MEEDSIVEEFFSFFRKIIGEPRAIQRLWAKRVLRGESFAAVAPTGIGKTSFGVAMSLFMASKGKTSYILLPTTLLINQVIEDLKKYSKDARINLAFNDYGEIVCAYYHGDLTKNEKDKFFEILEKGDFKILITTPQFLSRHFSIINSKTFDFIFVDDVDSVLKASKNVDRILMLLGFRKEKNEWTGEAKGVLMVSTATAKKGQKIALFKKLLNLDVGTSTHTVRNIEDIKINSEDIETIVQILRKMGTGGLIYARNSQEAEKLYESLKDMFKVGKVSASRKKDFELFEKGELDYLIGTAFYYGALVRGLDLPERIRFVIFVGAPVFRLKVEDIDEASPGIIKVLALIFRDRDEIKPYIPFLQSLEKREKELEELKRILKKLIGTKIEEKDIVVRENEIIFPDIRTYIQGSGRTSRLFAGGITKGASFLLEKDQDILRAFIERAKYFDIEFKDINEVDFDSLIKEINETREKYKMRKKLTEVIRPALFIVESPTKAKQISRFFGLPSIKVISKGSSQVVVYEVSSPYYVLLVTACLGHVTDLVTDKGFYGVKLDGNKVFTPIYTSIKRCKQCGHQFTEDRAECPRCKSTNIDDSKHRIEILRELAHDSELVIIGTDPDSEGEKIAWDLKNLLAGCGEIKRAEFHEVTRRALMESLSNLRDISENLVKAQIVRRIEDRWIGFALSQKIQRVFNDRNLSAGRAQTPVLGWIIGRAKEHKEKKKIAIVKDLDLLIELDSNSKLSGYTELDLDIKLIDRKVESKTPLPPYTTNTMLRDANAILKIPVKEAMRLAQDLFEAGLCVTPDTLVFTENGIDEIKNIESNKNILSMNSTHPEFTSILKFWKIKYNGLLKEIKLDNGYTIRATPDHGLFILRDGKIGWVSAKNIKVGDYIALVYNVNNIIKRRKLSLKDLLNILKIEHSSNEKELELDEDFWYLVGHLIACNEKDWTLTMERIKKFIIYKEQNANKLKLAHQVASKIKAGENCGFIFLLPENQVNSLISGLFDACGEVLINKNSEELEPLIILKLENEKFVRKLGFYLHLVGIPNEIDEASLKISGKYVKAFTRLIGTFVKVKRRALNELQVLNCVNCNYQEDYANGSVLWVKVSEIRDIKYNGFVYDVTTKTSNFFANVMLNHNCTYHRTDSTRVSDVGMRIAKEYLENDFVGREWYAEGAHECIRPTRPIDKNTLQRLIQEGVIQAENITRRHLALYDLIFRRFMASQCKPYIAEVAKYEITLNGKKIEEERVLSAQGRAIDLYKWCVWIKKELPTGHIRCLAQIKTVPKAYLFTQSDVIQLMKERGIGRPSTYATILDRLFMRNYVIERNGKIIPTKRGVDVYNYLSSNYSQFVSEERTRLLEEKMDAIEKGDLDYLKALFELYEEVRKIT